MEYTGSLHNHTDFSNIRLRDCTNTIETLIDRAIELGHKCIAITDHETLANAVKVEKYYSKIKKEHPEFKVIRGNEIYLCRNGLNAQNYNKDNDKYYHFILLAKDLVGMHQLMEISTRAWTRSYMARGMRRVPTYYQDLIDIIGANPGHIVGSTACLGGALATQILKGTPDEKLDIWIRQMDNLFGHGNFFFEMQPSENKQQILVNKKLYEFGHKYNIPYIITTDSHYLTKEDRIVHKAYLNAQNGEREIDDFYATTYLMGTEELESYFPYFEKSDLVHAYESIENIMNMCEDYSIMKPLKIPSLKWKIFNIEDGEYEYYSERIPMLKTFKSSEFSADRHLVYAVIDGIKRHPDLQNQEAYDELNKCLDDTWVSSTVNKAQWSAYYLNLQQIIDLCWEAGSLVGPGRGSGVGFTLLYCLDITQINPLRETTKTFRWRFLNPERVSVLDVDFDIEGGRRANVLNKFREYYGSDRVANVATYRTEKSKSAVLTAARGLGIDVDIAQYVAGLIPSDRGMIRSLSQCFYGDEENAPIKQFVYEMTENYPELWNVSRKIEGLICGSGIHAGGVIFVDEPFTNSTALMRAPDGTICTQFELHDSEACSLIKYDALSVEAMDKIHNCIDLICDYGYAERKATLKETYESMLGVYAIERDNKEMWNMVWNHEIGSLFQMEQESGINGIAILKPTSVDDLAILNSTIRLMAQEKGGETPTEKLSRFKNHPEDWMAEMSSYGLTENEKKIIEPIVSISYGLCIAQEQFMELVQLPELGGFSLTWADKLRKSIAKKNPAEYDKLTKEFFDVTSEKGINQKFAHYVWDVLIAMSKGYGFNQSHTLAYSLIALQEMNLAFKYPIMFWNCACLISDSGGNESEDFEEAEEIIEEIEYTDSIEEFADEEDDEEDDEEEIKSKKKKKNKTTNYGRIAIAIGKIRSSGVEVSAPDINLSKYTFSPDVQTNTLLYGLSGISHIGEDLIKSIMINRPYSSVSDFLNKVKVNKTQMINLIKSGAFDSFGDRLEIMKNYVGDICGAKKKLTLQNVKSLIDYNLIPIEYDFQKRVFNFNKYLKKFKNGNYYQFDNIAYRFFESNFDMSKTVPGDTESGFEISVTTWDKIYKIEMEKLKKYIMTNHDDMLDKLNRMIMSEVWDKYCDGNISKWEMDSVSFYSHGHELDSMIEERHGLDRFANLPTSPDIEKVIPIKGKQIPIFKISRIAGTILDKNKAKKTVTLLTKDGVVSVKIFGDVYSHYDRQISEKGADGHKHVIEKSWFQRGNKIIVTGVRQDGDFRAKKYTRTPFHLVELITKINNDGTIETIGTRAGDEEE